mmetsp:Transcript_21104/g.24295  ORF Transcript_21104/g.24295 Transcript_21104/m.24295 type:complete len:155 (+) Transcript_21104:31-495(+)
MRLLTHNTLRNNSAEAAASKINKIQQHGEIGGGYPLKITATEVRVDTDSASNDNSSNDSADREVAFVTGILGTIEWEVLVKAASSCGLGGALPKALTEDLTKDPTFLRALYHVLMNVHVVSGMLTCPTTGREFPITNGIVNFMLEEDECEIIRA